MEFIIMMLIFFHGIFWHEIGHIVYYLKVFKDYPKVRIRKSYIQILPKKRMSNEQQSLFLGVGIILGMFSFVPFFFYYSIETSLSMIAYLFACGMDFNSLIKLYRRL